jgi:hypothetical protein
MFFVLSFSLCINSQLICQNNSNNRLGSIAGTILDKSSSEPLIGATVMLEGTKIGTRTNKSGYYSLQKIPAGEYNLLVRFMGYKQSLQKITLKTGADLRINIELEEAAVQTEGVQVVADREAEHREISISRVNVPINQIKEIRVGGESDIFRTIQFLPGVLTSSQVSSGLYVRGGSPDQNLVLLDGAAIYNPSHLFGFFSTFNTNAVKDVEFIKGGFNAEYGGRLSSVLNITQKEGNKKEVEGNLSIGLISSQIGIEVPLGNGSIFVSGRRSYFDILLPVMELFTDATIPDFYFYDINAKITQEFGENDKVSISGFLGKDALNFGSTGTSINMNVENRLLSGHWTHIFGNSLFSTFVVNYSKYRNQFSGGQTSYAFIMDNSIEDITAKANVEWYLGENASLIFGAEVNKLDFDFLMNFTGDTVSTTQGENGQLKLQIPDLNYAAFVQSKFNLTEYLSVQAGLRGSYYQLNGEYFIDPRLAVRYMLSGNISLKAAWGIYHQALRIAGIPNFSICDAWLPSDTSVSVSKSNHYIFSIETRPSENFDLNFDLYYKTMNGIGELNQMTLTAEKVTDVLFIGNAYSYGAEVFVQKTIGRLTGWAGYGLGFIYAKFDSINHGNEFHPKYDRTHDFKVVMQYKLFDNWEVGGTFTLQSGQSYTGATSRGKTLLPDQTFGNSKITMSDLYGLRLPMSHQLNLYVAYSFKMWSKNARFVIDIFNVYNRRDILMRMYNTRDEVTVVEDMRLLPIIPSLSFEVKF